MTETPSKYECFLCLQLFELGSGVYAGKPVSKWGGIMVCNGCRGSNWDGIVPSAQPHLVEHLQSKGIPYKLNENG